ncbi:MULTISPECIES: cation:proton antiporter [unclassified Coleofasciculus]|uniref:cation:proton antiporter n=1 Tax=unclassified Coleofasciculus TaxID=2692782 RepID=UPI0018809FFD|nr:MULTISPECIES: cation:proton antiporter [unclassified Coleofasciculus]MBE9125823.1 cation:proton antiporter [Coleofasciculus sp. LEGE 07081]MBE9148992.1 cation:proton antiporter [Coleofasciculus sp. LEGE 07092]
MEQVLERLSESPIFGFTILLFVIVTIPPLFERLRLPGLVGLLVAGVILGPDALGLLDLKSDSMKLLSDIGKIYLMFVAGLEIDLVQFRKNRNRSLGFGLSTFLVPLIVGTIVGRIFGFGWNASILIGSLFASHTLLGYPIVNRLGLVANEAVTVTIGATIFTDIAALLVLAICVSIHAGEFSLASLIVRLGALGLYSLLVLFGFGWAGKEYFRRTGDEQSNQFLFVLLAVFLASVGAQVIQIEEIVGAFLAGLAVNNVVGHGPVKEKVVFVGSTLFIPCFFVGMGLLLDIPVFIQTLSSDFGLTLSIVVGLIVSKFLAALIIKVIYRYNWNETITMWSLSMPQVAATLAATLVGFQVGLLTEAVFNSVIVLMLVTSLVGPVLTARYAAKLPLPKSNIETDRSLIWWEAQEEELALEKGVHQFTVVVPISNPLTERYLIEIAALLAHHESGVIVPLSIATANVHMDEPQINVALRQSQQLLNRALDVSKEFKADARPKIRIDDDIAQGISRTAREENAGLIVMGWSETMGLRARLFGNVIDSVFWASHCPVAVMRLLKEPIEIRRILVPVKNLTPQTVRTVRFAQLVADTNQGQITLLHVCDRRTPPEQIAQFKTELLNILSQAGLQVKTKIKAVAHDDVARVILKAAQSFDLVILRSVRRRTAGGLTVSDVTTQVIQEITCSMVLFGEPHS